MKKTRRTTMLLALIAVLALAVAALVACANTAVITFDGNGATGGTAPQAINTTMGSTVTLPECELTKTGHTFDGWKTGDTTYKAGDTFKVTAAETAFVAQWKAEQGEPDPDPQTYALTYAKGDHGTGTAPAAVQKEAGAKFNLAAATLFTAETGYEFDGWSDGANSYAADAEFTMPAKAVTMTAQWKAVQHTVTFDPNNEGAVWTVKVNHGETVAKPSEDPTISSGKMFRYWTDDSGEYNFSTPVTEDIELTATYAWKITFLAGDGATGTVAPQWVSVWRPNAITLPQATGLSNGSKVFVGWNDGTATYDAGDLYGTSGLQNVTFTAQWKDAQPVDPNKFTLTFTLGTGGEGTPPAARQLAEGETTILPDGTGMTIDSTEYPNYVFLGWSIKWNSEILKAGSTYTMPAANTTLQARWGEQPSQPDPTTKYTVTYKSGDHGTGADITETLSAGKITLKAADTFTAESGYAFGGWQLVGGTEEDIYVANGQFILSQNVQFVALWMEQYVAMDNDMQAYLIWFPSVSYGYIELEDETTVEFYTEISGNNVTIMLENEAVFNGTFIDNVLTVTITYGKLTLSFGTQQVQQHTVTFNPMNAAEPATWTVKVNHGETVAKPSQDPVIDDGRMFRRWATADGEFDFSTPITEDITIEATYGYKVSFSLGNGVSGSISPMWAPGQYSGITLPSIGSITNGDKTFEGWSDGTNTYQAGTRYQVETSITLNAVWKEAQQPADGYTLAFEGDNGTAPAPQTKQQGDSIILPENTWFYSDIQGYVFAGWYVKSDGYNSKLYQPGDSYTMPNKDVTFRARFEQPTFTVTYKAGDKATGADVVEKRTQNENISLKSLSELSNAFTPEENYVLIGWKLDGDTSEKIYSVGEEYLLEGNVTFVAQWQLQTMIGFEDVTGTSMITMSFGNGSVGSGEFYIYGQDDTIGFMYTLDGEAITFKMNDSKQFVGTFANKQLIVTITYDSVDYVFDSTQAASGPKVTFDANGGTGEAPEASLTETTNGYKLTLPAADAFTAPAGQQFKEWNVTIDGKDCGGYIANKNVVISSSDKQIVVKAIWEDIPVIEEPTGITFVGNCTTPTTTDIFGSKGGQTYIKFIINFDTNEITYYISDGTHGTKTLPAPASKTYMPNDLGEDATYYTEIAFADTAKYNIVVKADKSQLLLCDNNDNKLASGLFTVGSIGGDEPEYVSVAFKNLIGKTFVAESAFYTVGSNEYTKIAITWHDTFGYRIECSTSTSTTPRRFAQDSSISADKNQSGVSLTAEHSSSYDTITIKFIQDGDNIRLAVTSLTLGQDKVEQITDVVYLNVQV